MQEPPQRAPDISVVILGYNGMTWVDRCFRSIQAQTIFDQLEIIVSDNASTDGSEAVAEQWISTWRNGQVIRNASNLGFCAGNNVGAAGARGRYLFFVNNDTWLEPDCLRILLAEADRAGAAGATPLVMDYDTNDFQGLGGDGFDLFGLSAPSRRASETIAVFIGYGAAFMVRREVFAEVGGFDPELFMYVDEVDLSCRIWMAGHKIIGVPAARMHHRGAASVNPEGRTVIVEQRTSDTKRFFTNRNNLLLWLKNGQHVLLALALTNLLWLAAEALVALVLLRRWSHVRRAYLNALADCWRLRHHIFQQRRQIQQYRQRSDWWMLRFLRWTPSRWPEVKKLFTRGVPRVDSR